jgi:hypothetical protein
MLHPLMSPGELTPAQRAVWPCMHRHRSGVDVRGHARVTRGRGTSPHLCAYVRVCVCMCVCWLSICCEHLQAASVGLSLKLSHHAQIANVLGSARVSAMLVNSAPVAKAAQPSVFPLRFHPRVRGNNIKCVCVCV